MSFIEKIIEEYKSYQIPSDIQKTAKEFMQADVKCIVGCNTYAENICKNIKIDYIVDDYTDKENFCNIPIIKFEQLPKNAAVANCVLNARYIFMHDKLKNYGIKIVVGFLDLCSVYPDMFEMPFWIEDMRHEIKQNKDRFQKVYDNLDDEISRKTLKDIILFRLTADKCYLADYDVKLDEQYFEPFSLNNVKTFVDCGGFDGATTKQFIKSIPDYNKVYFFEPSCANLETAKSNLGKYKNITYINAGVSDKNQTVRFNTSLGSSSSIAEDGEVEIRVVKIDDFLQEKNALIKMDVEGSELSALKGAKDCITDLSPNLAICIYHKATDFYEVYEYIKSIAAKPFKTYIRHYSQGWNETVMFITFC